MASDERLVALSGSPEVQAYLRIPNTAAYIVRRGSSRDSEIVWASPSIASLLGHDPQDLVGRNAWHVLVAPEDIVPASEYSARMSEGDLVGWAPLVRKDGRKSWFRFEALNRAGGIVVILRPETDTREHRFHWFGRPTPGRS